MVIRYHKRFEKSFRKLPNPIRGKVKKTISRFSQDPFHPRLRNHALKGTLQGLRAISVTGNIRIIFHEEGNYQSVTVVDVGTHNQVY